MKLINRTKYNDKIKINIYNDVKNNKYNDNIKLNNDNNNLIKNNNGIQSTFNISSISINNSSFNSQISKKTPLTL